MKIQDFMEGTGAAVSVALAGVSWADVELGLKIVSSALSIIVAIITLWLTIKTWYKKASADGKITKEEIDEGIEIAKDGVSDVRSAVDKTEKTIEDNSKGSKEK